MREIVLDTETTGLDFENDKVIEIGIVELKDNILTQSYFHEYVNPEKNISLSAQKVHGISNEFLIGKPTFNEVAKKFLDFIKDDTIIIHNAEFDISHLNNELKIAGKDLINNEIIDTVTLARDKFPGSSNSLDALCRRYRIDNSKREKHTALIDCDLLSKVYINLTDQREPTLDFQEKLSDKNVVIDIGIASKLLKDCIDLYNYKNDKTKINTIIKFNGFRSICPVTSQPDFANIYIYCDHPINTRSVSYTHLRAHET